MHPEPGEQVFFRGHPCWRAFPSFYLKGLVAAVLIGAAAGFVSAIASGRVQTSWVVIAVLAMFVIVLVGGLAKQARTTYTITNHRLTVDTGLLSRDLHQTRLERVQDVDSRQTPLQRLLGVGTVDFATAGGAEYEFSFRGVDDPRHVVQTVNYALRQLRRADAGL